MTYQLLMLIAVALLGIPGAILFGLGAYCHDTSKALDGVILMYPAAVICSLLLAGMLLRI